MPSTRLLLHPQIAVAAAAIAMNVSLGCSDRGSSIQPLQLDASNLHEQLEVLGAALAESRIVLLGENGHGVAEFTETKVELIRWLYEEHGFDVVAFESGFFECGHVWDRITELAPAEALLQCLRYPFQHAELLPLFELLHAQRSSERPLQLAGIDIQAQGFDSEIRPAALHAVVSSIDRELADRVAAFDTAIFLPERSGGLGDSVYPWLLEHGGAARKAYTEAADVTPGWERLAFRLAAGLVDRLEVRARATALGQERPGRYYALRDEWMARAVSALADSLGDRRKVVVWLHNDHARYGDFQTGTHRIRSAGSYLREWFGEEVFTVGFFMGRGTIADNGRNQRDVAVTDPESIERFLAGTGTPASYVVLRGNSRDSVRMWASVARPYLRMGLDPRTMVPASEFDALVFIDRVRPPDYRVR